jgi:hypothetical protein
MIEMDHDASSRYDQLSVEGLSACCSCEGQGPTCLLLLGARAEHGCLTLLLHRDDLVQLRRQVLRLLPKCQRSRALASPFDFDACYKAVRPSKEQARIACTACISSLTPEPGSGPSPDPSRPMSPIMSPSGRSTSTEDKSQGVRHTCDQKTLRKKSCISAMPHTKKQVLSRLESQPVKATS